MSWWATLAAIVGVLALGTVVLSWRERVRQRRMAETRPALTRDRFVALVAADGPDRELASFLWGEFVGYYHAPLTPYPSDRVLADLRIDPDDLTGIAGRYEQRFGVWLGEVGLDCEADPTIIGFGRALQRGGISVPAAVA